MATSNTDEDAWTEIYVTTDQLELTMAKTRLEAEGIPVRILGSQRAALLGAAEHIFKKRIEVPFRNAQTAADLVGNLGELAEPIPDELRETDGES